LQKENDLTEQEVAKLDTEYRADHPEGLQPSIAGTENDQKDTEADQALDAPSEVEAGEKSTTEIQTGVKSDVAVNDSKP
jgi:hypothetical protein